MRRTWALAAALAVCGAVWWLGSDDEPVDCREALRLELMELQSQTRRPDFPRRLRELAKRLDDCAESLLASPTWQIKITAKF